MKYNRFGDNICALASLTQSCGCAEVGGFEIPSVAKMIKSRPLPPSVYASRSLPGK